MSIDFNNLGWVPPENRTDEQNEEHARIVASMPGFAIYGDAPDSGDKVVLWEFSKAANGGKHFRVFYQKTGSCLKGDAPVRMADGTEKPIANVAIGDEVITHTGQARRVVHTFRRLFSGDMVTLVPTGFAFPVTVTADHQVAVMKGERLTWQRADTVTEGDSILIGWDRRESKTSLRLDMKQLLGQDAVELDELMKEGAFKAGALVDVPVANVCMARHVVRQSGIDWKGKIKLRSTSTKNAIHRFVSVTPSFARLMGLYLAEGGCHEGRVVFTFHAKETHYADEVLDLVRGIFGVEGELCYQQHRPNVLKVRFNNANLAAVLKALMPGNVYTKRVPGFFFSMNKETKLALLLGWLNGDGHASLKDPRRLNISGCSVCKDLARDMSVLALSCGIRVATHKRKARGHSKAAYVVALSGDKVRVLYPAIVAKAEASGIRPQKTDSKRTSFGYARHIKRVETETVKDLPVFDIEVEEDHSFLSNDITVHNCVGNGLGQALWYLSAVDAVRLRLPIEAKLPFYLLPYGRSRFHSGMRGRGDGSTGSGAAKAAREDGIVAADTPGLPPVSDEGGLTWGSRAELDWSDGARISEEWLSKSRKHLVKTTALIRSVDDARAALKNLYPLTIASNWGGQMRCSQSGDPAVLLNRHAGTWNHQMCVIGWWNHPSLGEIYYVLNSWGINAHGEPPDDAPPGGFWIKASDLAYIIRQGETFAFSQWTGFPAQHVSWIL